MAIHIHIKMWSYLIHHPCFNCHSLFKYQSKGFETTQFSTFSIFQLQKIVIDNKGAIQSPGHSLEFISLDCRNLPQHLKSQFREEFLLPRWINILFIEVNICFITFISSLHKVLPPLLRTLFTNYPVGNRKKLSSDNTV